MGGPADQNDVVAVAREHAAVITADRAGTENCKPHG
jgi:hypothetical protein